MAVTPNGKQKKTPKQNDLYANYLHNKLSHVDLANKTKPEEQNKVHVTNPAIFTKQDQWELYQTPTEVIKLTEHCFSYVA